MVAARGEAAPLVAVTGVAVMLTAGMVEVAAAFKIGLHRRLRRGAATTAVGTGAATVGVAAVPVNLVPSTLNT